MYLLMYTKINVVSVAISMFGQFKLTVKFVYIPIETM